MNANPSDVEPGDAVRIEWTRHSDVPEACRGARATAFWVGPSKYDDSVRVGLDVSDAPMIAKDELFMDARDLVEA